MTQTFNSFVIGKSRGKSKFWSRFRKRPIPAGQYRWDKSLRSMAAVIILCFCVLVARLAYLQLIHGDDFSRKSTQNFSREIKIPALRGEIRDCFGKVLARSEPSYRLYIAPVHVKAEGLVRLQKYMQLSDEQFSALKQKIDERTSRNRDSEILAFDHLKREQVALIESDRQNLAGIRISVHAKRAYYRGPSDPSSENEGPEGPKKLTDARMLAHLLGYVNQVGPDDISDGYLSDAVIGRAGIEGSFEKELRGQSGFEHFTADASGRRRYVATPDAVPEEERKRDPVPGNHIQLTIDMRLQRFVFQSIVDPERATAAAVVDVKTGRILALASRPAPDWNQRLTSEGAKKLETDRLQPLRDRAMKETYFPASTFKLITALTAFQQHGKHGFRFDPYDRIKCTGEHWYLGQRFKCTGSHGLIGLHGALVRSCNVYFYKLAERINEKLGIDAIAATARQLGLGEPTNLDMGEPKGFIPSEEYYRNHGGFMPGYTLNTVIGQGDVRASVLQMAMAYATFANGGSLYQPILIDKIESPSGLVLKRNMPQIRSQVRIPKDVWSFINQSLRDVVFKQSGTANKSIRAEFPKMPVELAGKTGTAQLASGRNRLPNNAWFVGYAPAHDPVIAIAVFVEEGGHGGESAAPMAMRIAQKYFEQIYEKPPKQ